MQFRGGAMCHPHDVALGAHGGVVTVHAKLLLDADLAPAITCVHTKNATVVLRVGSCKTTGEIAVTYLCGLFRGTGNTCGRVLS